MVSIAGSSQYYNASVLANTRQMAAQSPTLLGASDAVSILDAAKGILSRNGIGISSRARTLNAQFLNNTADINKLLSLGAGSDATVQGATTIIKALRSRYGSYTPAPPAGTTVNKEA